MYMIGFADRHFSLTSIFKIETSCSKGHLFYSAWPRRVALRPLRALFSNHQNL